MSQLNRQHNEQVRLMREPRGLSDMRQQRDFTVPYGDSSMRALKDQTQCTPDFFDLKTSDRKEHLVLIYDNLKTGKFQHHLLDGANYYGPARTMMKRYLFKMNPTNQFPLAFSLKQKNKANTKWFTDRDTIVDEESTMAIKGELYGVPLRGLCGLDLLYNNGQNYKREKDWVKLDDPDTNQSPYCWIYVASQSKWSPENDIRMLSFANGAHITVNNKKTGLY